MQEPGASDAFAGVAFHCYVGQVSDQDTFHNNFPDKEIYFTECSGVLGSDFWNDLQVSSLNTSNRTEIYIFHEVVYERSVSLFAVLMALVLISVSLIAINQIHWRIATLGSIRPHVELCIGPPRWAKTFRRCKLWRRLSCCCHHQRIELRA